MRTHAHSRHKTFDSYSRRRLLFIRHTLRRAASPLSAGRLPGLGALKKLTSSPYVDSEPIRHDLGWTPPFTTDLRRRQGRGGFWRHQRETAGSDFACA
jgi:hypothetical protein